MENSSRWLRMGTNCDTKDDLPDHTSATRLLSLSCCTSWFSSFTACEVSSSSACFAPTSTDSYRPLLATSFVNPAARCILSSVASNSDSKLSKRSSMLCAEACCCRACSKRSFRICLADSRGACNSSSSISAAPVVLLKSSQAEL